MPITPSASDPAKAKPMTDEADIGSGEKTPAQLETEELIRQIPPLQPGQDQAAKDGAPTPKPDPV
jgi:hypothetical protein